MSLSQGELLDRGLHQLLPTVLADLRVRLSANQPRMLHSQESVYAAYLYDLTHACFQSMRQHIAMLIRAADVPNHQRLHQRVSWVMLLQPLHTMTWSLQHTYVTEHSLCSQSDEEAKQLQGLKALQGLGKSSDKVYGPLQRTFEVTAVVVVHVMATSSLS